MRTRHILLALPAALLALATPAHAQPAPGGAVNLRTPLAIPGALVPRTLLSKLGERLSVMDFGAACNGVADDSAAIAAAAAAAPRTVDLPAGMTCQAPGIPAMPGNLTGGGTLLLTGGGAAMAPSVAGLAAAVAIPMVTPTGATVQRRVADIAAAALAALTTVNVTQPPYNAVPDGKTLIAPVGAYIAGSQGLTVVGGAFTRADVGKVLLIDGLGANGGIHVTHIAAGSNGANLVFDDPIKTASSGIGGQVYRIDYGTDDSVAIQAAHDAAVRAGQRYVFFPPGLYMCQNTVAIWNTIFVGDGRLIGAYKKQVVPLSASAKSWFPSQAQPSQQFKNLNAAMAASTASNPAVVVIVGTSRNTVPSTRNEDSTAFGQLRRRLRDEFPSAHFTVIDRAIGGSTMAMLNGDVSVAAATVPYWDTNTAAGHWLPDFVQPLLPDLVVIGGPFNDAVNLLPSDISGIVATIQSWSHKADIAFMVDGNASMQYNQAASFQEGYDYASGFLRTYARANGFAVIDLYRLSAMLRDGYDPDASIPTMGADLPVGGSVTNQLSALPIRLPQTRDYSILLGDLIGYTLWPHGSLIFQLSRNPGNQLLISHTMGANSVTIQINGATTPVVGYGVLPATTIAMPAAQLDGGFTLAVNVNGGRLYVLLNQTPIYEGPIARWGGLFTPAVSLSDGATVGCDISWDEGIYQPIMPQVTDQELYGRAAAVAGSIDPALGGNGTNHYGNLAVRRLIGGALDLTRFAQ